MKAVLYVSSNLHCTWIMALDVVSCNVCLTFFLASAECPVFSPHSGFSHSLSLSHITCLFCWLSLEQISVCSHRACPPTSFRTPLPTHTHTHTMLLCSSSYICDYKSQVVNLAKKFQLWKLNLIKTKLNLFKKPRRGMGAMTFRTQKTLRVTSWKTSCSTNLSEALHTSVCKLQAPSETKVTHYWFVFSTK